MHSGIYSFSSNLQSKCISPAFPHVFVSRVLPSLPLLLSYARIPLPRGAPYRHLDVVSRCCRGKGVSGSLAGKGFGGRKGWKQEVRGFVPRGEILDGGTRAALLLVGGAGVTAGLAKNQTTVL